MTASARTGGEILVDALRVNGVERAFCVPGESYLEALDALYDARDAIALVACRQEGGASYMAEAYGKLTGRPGICFVTRGPGATNAAIGLHTAMQDSTPMICFVGQVGRGMRDREAFQEIDVRAVFGSLVKWAAQIEAAARIPEYVARAFHVATSGRPGPVVLGLPEDVLAERAVVPPVTTAPVVRAYPHPSCLMQLRTMLANAQRPLVVLGGSGWTEHACAQLREFVEASSIPVVCAFRRQHLFDNRHPLYLGDAGIGMAPHVAEYLRDADLLLAIGTRLSEASTNGYTLVTPPRPAHRFVHVHVDPDELGRVYQADLPINAGMPEFADALRGVEAIHNPPWRAWASDGRAAYERTLSETMDVEDDSQYVDLAHVVKTLDARLPDDAIVANGAGNFAAWVQRYYRFRSLHTQLAPTNGSMGYGFPAAIAAKLLHPRRIVVAFCGDGDFLMNGQELATAVQYDAPIVVLVANNEMYGTIRMHQEREHPAREIATALRNPDFVAYATAFGAHAELVESNAEFAPAFEAALASGRPAVIELRTDPERITSRTTLEQLRAAAPTASVFVQERR